MATQRPAFVGIDRGGSEHQVGIGDAEGHQLLQRRVIIDMACLVERGARP
jgi:hypothetical protein